MPYGLYISAEGAQAQSMRLDVIANNLANVDTAGFKRELAVMQARYAEAIDQGLQEPGTGEIEDVGGGVTLSETKTDYSSGPLINTKNPAHVAVKGEGFFLIQKDEETFLTRAGNFTLTAAGGLTTQQGYPVLNQDGAPIMIDPTDANWRITSQGAVHSRGTVQNLALVQPESLGDLVRVGENLFKPLSDPQPVAAEKRTVAPRFIEGSGVKPTTEMVELIQASRALEANVNMMKAQDEMLAGLVNRVLRA